MENAVITYLRPVKWDILHSESNLPYANLALEQHLVESVSRPTLLLYVNSESVVIGKHQNPFKQVNVPYCLKNNILICRRYSGGGTVYHDHGNLNYAFIDVRSPERFGIDYDLYTIPIRDFLRSFQLNAEVSERHDILVDGFKVSGTAQHLHQKRKVVLHHGTLLIRSKLDQLGDALKPGNLKIEDSSIDSVRSRVINLNKYMPEWTPESVIHSLTQYMDTSDEVQSIDPTQVEPVSSLMQQRYGTEDWNFGYSPAFKFHIGNESYSVRKGQFEKEGWPIAPAALANIAEDNPTARAVFKALYN